MKTGFVVRLFCMLGAGVVGGIVGMIIGAYLGGNYAVGFQFNGVRGYEATGQLGFIIGAALGVIITWKRTKKK